MLREELIDLEGRVDHLLELLGSEQYPGSIKDILAGQLTDYSRAISRLMGAYTCLLTREVNKILDREIDEQVASIPPKETAVENNIKEQEKINSEYRLKTNFFGISTV
jgi:hypothetical protein